MSFLIVANFILTASIVLAAAGYGTATYVIRGRRRKERRLAAAKPDYAVRSDWKTSRSNLNYSSFVYFDVDRDGIYGQADRPIGGMVVRLSREARPILAMRTNTNGFANFKMSTLQRKAQIKFPGTYRFTVSVPSGWVCTSRNDVQEMSFGLIEGSPAGIGAPEMVRPVGLAPLRLLKGAVTDGEAISLRFLQAGKPVGNTETVSADFAVRVPDHADEVEASGDTGFRLALSSYPEYLGVISSRRARLSASAELETISFDDVTPGGLKKIPSGYAGLNWFNLNVIARDFHGNNEGYVNGNTSGDHMCYTSSGHPAEFWSEAPFGFHSVMLSAAWSNSEGETCIVEVWRDDTLVARDEIVVSAWVPVHYAPMLGGVTKVRFSSRHYWQIVVDDLVISR